ncbi:hypothetical protein BDV41DRAFT_526446, partial [Aspergillus transmontanensis]
MRQSWVNGDFWVTYAARKNFAFDTIVWKKLDHRLLVLAPLPRKVNGRRGLNC